MSSENFEIDPSVLQGFLDEARDALASVDALFVQLESDPYNVNIISAIFRPVHSIKGNAPFFGLMRLKHLAHEFESVLAALRDKKIAPNQGLFTLLLSGIDELKAVIDRVAQQKPEVADEATFTKLVEAAQGALKGSSSSPQAPSAPSTAKAPAPSTAEAAPTPVPPEKPKEHVEPAAPKSEPSKTMRVSEERIDTFLGFVGELVIAQDMLRHFTSKLEGRLRDHQLIHELGTINGVIANLGSGLERAIMSIRKVPIRSLVQKVPRLIRDVATAKGKEIDVVISGDEIEIDKSLVELLDAPITHMARNAADHGIELPEKRIKSGKLKKGTVRVECRESPNDIVLTVSDDGAGLNYDGLRKKAESLGLLRPGEPLTDVQAVNLIFMAGVSTAQEVSDISGRGVGMDVVKRNVEAAGGAITVVSQAGKGSEFTLRLPKSVTTQIMQGFVVQVDKINLVLPLKQVQESWRLNTNEIIQVVSRGPQVQRHNQILPLVNLEKFLRLDCQHEVNESQLVVTLNTALHPLAIQVDEIIGPRQVVLKPLDESTNTNNLFLGGALMGDGTVALILDVAKLQPCLN